MITIVVAIMLQGAAAAPTVVVKSDARDQKVCRKYVETGSLVRTTKVCRTRAEWLRAEQEAKEEGLQRQNNPNPNAG